ncbi:hypothetical protein MP638_003013 [Amoeboaphelidium occidentale]|nr:hypothetical protein MP638_003013 [Amoeboaphelidium occidentale]
MPKFAKATAIEPRPAQQQQQTSGGKATVDKEEEELAGIVECENDGKKKYQFTRELRLMAYGFGDASPPSLIRTDTLELLEEMMLEYVQDLSLKAAKVAANTSSTGNFKVKIEDFLFVLRKDAKKYQRAKELLFRYDELLKARKAFEDA